VTLPVLFKAMVVLPSSSESRGAAGVEIGQLNDPIRVAGATAMRGTLFKLPDLNSYKQ